MKYFIKTGLLCITLIFGMGNFVFSEEPIDTFSQIKDGEKIVEFAKTLSLREVVILGSQIVDKYDMENAFYFAMDCLGPRWAEDPSTVPETIHIVLTEKVNPKWREFIISNFKRLDFSGAYKDTDSLSLTFLSYLQDPSKDPKTKVVLLEILGCWFDGYKDHFTKPQHEYLRTKENFEIVNKQANRTIDSLDKIVRDKSTNRDVSVASKALLSKIHQIYLDENNVLPSEFKKLDAFKQVKSKMGVSY